MGNVVDKDLGYGRVIRILESIGDTEAQIGIHDNPEVATIALINEFGAGRIPERPLWRMVFDRNQDAYEKHLVEKLEQAAAGRGGSYTSALSQTGALIRDDLRAGYDTERSALKPNAPMTIAKKGFDHPRVETSTERQAITSKLAKAGSGGTP